MPFWRYLQCLRSTALSLYHIGKHSQRKQVATVTAATACTAVEQMV